MMHRYPKLRNYIWGIGLGHSLMSILRNRSKINAVPILKNRYKIDNINIEDRFEYM